MHRTIYYLRIIGPALLLAGLTTGPVWAQGNAPSWSDLVEDLSQPRGPRAREELYYRGNGSGAAGPPQATIASRVFATELAAVSHAMNRFNPRSVREDREYIGALYQLPRGGFFYSVAPGKAGSDQVSASIPRLKTARIVAFWHTHGGPHWSREYFSDFDSRLVKQWQLPFYMACADGRLRVLRPNHRPLNKLQARRRGLGNISSFAEGELIDAVTIAVR